LLAPSAPDIICNKSTSTPMTDKKLLTNHTDSDTRSHTSITFRVRISARRPPILSDGVDSFIRSLQENATITPVHQITRRPLLPVPLIQAIIVSVDLSKQNQKHIKHFQDMYGMTWAKQGLQKFQTNIPAFTYFATLTQY